jgi:hypothetical protein
MVKARKVVTKRKRPAHVKKPLDPKEIFPEIKSLPFLKHVGGPPGTSQLDHWAPPVEKIDGLDGNFLGETYALAMVRHMSRHPGEHPILSRIIERMIQRGQLYDPPITSRKASSARLQRS